jgi:hypothetical protein
MLNLNYTLILIVELLVVVGCLKGRDSHRVLKHIVEVSLLIGVVNILLELVMGWTHNVKVVVVADVL